jgi:hypothetical protein
VDPATLNEGHRQGLIAAENAFQRRNEELSSNLSQLEGQLDLAVPPKRAAARESAGARRRRRRGTSAAGRPAGRGATARTS